MSTVYYKLSRKHISHSDHFRVILLLRLALIFGFKIYKFIQEINYLEVFHNYQMVNQERRTRHDNWLKRNWKGRQILHTNPG